MPPKPLFRGGEEDESMDLRSTSPDPARQSSGSRAKASSQRKSTPISRPDSNISASPDRALSQTAPTSPPKSSLSSPKKSEASLRQQEEESRDPSLLASLPVYLSSSLPPSSRLSLFQYPTYPRGQPLPIPDSARSRGLSEAARWRPKANRVEVELPLDLRPVVYNMDKGQNMAMGAEHGGTFGKDSSAGSSAMGDDQRRVKVKREKEDLPAKIKRLERTRLESSLVPNQTKYMVGVIRDGALHLTPLDSVLQLRPSMHYLDGLDVQARKEAKADRGEEDDSGAEGGGGGGASGKVNGSASAAAAKRSIVNVTNRSGEDTKQNIMRTQHEAEAESWIELAWKTEETSEAQKVFESQLFASTKTPLQCTTKMREFLPSGIEGE
ncbi:RNA Polymerase C (III) 37 kDa subunit [Ceraceosorus bombacis]|uniref:RNA Polymerase C (III) 37 kDa subunit n=1 Tax=Ceraceosorus bombacis TaxID=401625 RepID=A0A0P1BEY2_9BASI|nr:RNA Polymerase C (III) 37 kDa subunit [Ceraceosorus bombacis]